MDGSFSNKSIWTGDFRKLCSHQLVWFLSDVYVSVLFQFWKRYQTTYRKLICILRPLCFALFPLVQRESKCGQFCSIFWWISITGKLITVIVSWITASNTIPIFLLFISMRVWTPGRVYLILINYQIMILAMSPLSHKSFQKFNEINLRNHLSRPPFDASQTLECHDCQTLNTKQTFNDHNKNYTKIFPCLLFWRVNSKRAKS